MLLVVLTLLFWFIVVNVVRDVRVMFKEDEEGR